MDRQFTPMPTFPLMDGTILLRLPEERDGVAIYAYGQDSDIEETAWLPIPFPCPQDAAIRTLQEFQRGWQGRHGLTLIITLLPEADLRGVLHLSTHTANVGEVGYGIAPDYRGRGLATRAVRLVAASVFTQLNLACLEIVITARDIHGLASRRVAEKAGFVYQGTRRSHILATDQDYEDLLYVLPAPGKWVGILNLGGRDHVAGPHCRVE